MGFHTFDPAQTDRLEDPWRFRFCSREELLQALPTDPESTVLDVGSGTGFYTDELAPYFGAIVGVDIQTPMHEQYRERGIPQNVSLVTADAERLPFTPHCFDGIVSTMTFHESASAESCDELYRVLSNDGRLVIVDWSREGRGESGPPVDERYDVANTEALLQNAGFTIETATERSETFLLVAHH